MAGFKGGYGGFGGGNMQNLMKQAQKMQEQMAKAQEELEETEIESSAGGGLVKVVVNGKKIMQSLSISPEAVDTEDMEMLEDLIMAAYNAAAEEAEKEYSEKMGAFGGLGGML